MRWLYNRLQQNPKRLFGRYSSINKKDNIQDKIFDASKIRKRGSEERIICLQVHNDYQVPGGETKTAKAIADLLESNGIEVIRYYRANNDIKNIGIVGKIKSGIEALYSVKTQKDIESILKSHRVDFALIHNTMPLISNSIYRTLNKKGIPTIKYLQNYNLLCLNGGMDNEPRICKLCQKHSWVGIIEKCYKKNLIYSLIKYISKEDMRKNVLNSISAFMTNSAYVMEKHKDLKIELERFFVMQNYIKKKETISIEISEKEYYLYFGRLTPEKGIRTVINAFKQRKDIRLVILGAGELKAEIHKIIINEQLTNIKFLGSKEGAELQGYIRNAKAAIISSEWDEPLPRTILEAYLEGTPVIGTDRGGIPEMIEEGRTGYIYKNGEVDDLLARIDDMERLDDTAYRMMRINAENKILKNYSPERYIERFFECLASIGIIRKN